jgi:hypothetical protein
MEPDRPDTPIKITAAWLDFVTADHEQLTLREFDARMESVPQLRGGNVNREFVAEVVGIMNVGGVPFFKVYWDKEHQVAEDDRYYHVTNFVEFIDRELYVTEALMRFLIEQPYVRDAGPADVCVDWKAPSSDGETIHTDSDESSDGSDSGSSLKEFVEQVDDDDGGSDSFVPSDDETDDDDDEDETDDEEDSDDEEDPKNTDA